MEMKRKGDNYMTPLDLAKKAALLLDDKKAMDIRVIKIEEISSLADYFVLVTGTSNTHVRSLSDEVEMKLKEQGLLPMGVEGYRYNSWILLDYTSVVIHIFTAEGREFYNLDRLWADGTPVALKLTPDSSIDGIRND